ncbi:MAG: FecR family protein, partial [Candidatus Aminicenantes bacterium]|nr:FecR family protein [Candidatus Aminicenantes bacterium]
MKSVLMWTTSAPQSAAARATPSAASTFSRITSSGRRCEIQFDTGTILRLDLDTELKVETILAQTLTSPNKATNLVLIKGRVFIMFREYDRNELFQVMTAQAAVKLGRDAVLMIKAAGDGFTDVQVRSGKASILYGVEAASASTQKVGKLERLIVSSDNQSQRAAYITDTDFEKWNDEVNANFMALHKGRSLLPKPVMRFSPGIVYFAQKYSNIYGEWLWDDLYGYIWRPFTNEYYPWGNWRPYINGRWTEAQGRLFWVPEEPWGWVPYHLGIWTWNKKLGWVWLPGSIFAPAWVDWAFFGGYYSWWPWSFFDWMMGFDDWGGWYYSYGWNNYWDYLFWWNNESFNEPNHPPTKKVLTQVSKGQLAQSAPSQSVPKELKSILENVRKAAGRGDGRVMDSLQARAAARVFIKPEDISVSQIRANAKSFDQLTVASEKSFREQFYEEARSLNPARQAARDFSASRDRLPPRTVPVAARPIDFEALNVSPLGELSQPSLRPQARVSGTTASPRGLSMRFRDWNPDIRAALKEGLTITYSSLFNEIRCPQLGISSRDVVMSSHSGRGASRTSFSDWSSSPNSSSSSSSSHSSSASSSSSSHGSGSGHSSGSGGTKKD